MMSFSGLILIAIVALAVIGIVVAGIIAVASREKDDER